MLAVNVGAVMRRIIVDEFDVGCQTSTCVRAFNQVVTEQCVTGKAFVEHFMKGGNFIDTFAGETSFAKQVLISIGNSVGVNVEAGLARVDGRQPGARRGLNRDADSR